MNSKRIIERINDGGESGYFLRDAVKSQYTGCAFDNSLNYFVSLDLEGRKLFLEILQYKTTQGWNDEVLSNILSKTEREL